VGDRQQFADGPRPAGQPARRHVHPGEQEQQRDRDVGDQPDVPEAQAQGAEGQPEEAAGQRAGDQRQGQPRQRRRRDPQAEQQRADGQRRGGDQQAVAGVRQGASNSIRITRPA
jgi:hypothetical protein